MKNITKVRVARFQLFRVYPNFSKAGEDQSGMKPIENNYIKTSDLLSQYCYELQAISINKGIDLKKVCFIENELSLNEIIKYLRINNLNEETLVKLHDMVDLSMRENDRAVNNFDKELKNYSSGEFYYATPIIIVIIITLLFIWSSKQTEEIENV